MSSNNTINNNKPAALTNIIHEDTTGATQPMDLSLEEFVTGNSAIDNSSSTPVSFNEGVQPDVESLIEQIRSSVQQGNFEIAQAVLNGSSEFEIEGMKQHVERVQKHLKYLEESQAAVTRVTSAAVTPRSSTIDPKDDQIPVDLPSWQLAEHVWKPNAESFDSLDNFLNRFEDILEARKFDIDRHWCRLLPITMHPDQREWFVNNLKPKNHLLWSEARAVITAAFDVQDHAKMSSKRAELNAMRMKENESVEQYTLRYQRVRREAQVPDDDAAAFNFIQTLLPYLYDAVFNAEVILPKHEKNCIDKSAARARLYQRHEQSKQQMGISSKAPVNVTKPKGKQVQQLGSAASMHNPANKPATSAKPAKVFCDFHESWGGHSSEECEKAKKFLAARGLSNRVSKPSSPLSHIHSSSPSGSAYGKTNICRSCDQNVQYSPEHRRVCPHNKTKKVRAVRSTRVVSTHTSSIDPDMMDTDELKVADDDHSFTACKYDLNKSITTAKNSYFSLLTLENIDTFALVDPGATISAIDYKYCIINKINVNKISTNEYILLAASNIKIRRIGTTDKLSFIHNNKAYTHVFEVMNLSDNIPISIGTDLMKTLGIGLYGLCTSYSRKAPSKPTEDRDTDLPTPNDSPYGSKEDRLQFKQAIQPYLQDNGKIPSDSFCTIPESIIYLDTPVGKTAYRKQYPIAHRLVPVLQECIDKWLADKIIRRAPDNREWNSPLTFAPKKDNQGNLTGLRPCLDPRLINALLPDDKFPLPHIDEIFEKLRGSSIFTTLDLRQAFHRFKIHEPHQIKTSFTFQGNQYCFVGCPFGLKPISSKFQRVINIVLQNCSFATAFVDDIIIYSKSFDEHIQHVKEIIQRLTKVNLILNPDKCYFAQQAVYLLGFCVNAKGVSLDPRKVCNALEWPAPKTGKDIQRFLGLCNYFRKFIPNIAQVSAPLDKLRFASTLGDLYTTDVQHAFTSLKKLLAEAPLLHYPDFSIPFRVATDASNYGIGACLYQVIDNEVRYIGFMARALTKSERNYSVTKRELLAIVYALKKFHTYLWGNKFYLYTDHKALIYIHTQDILNPMLVNWLDVICDYNFTIYHRPGIKNILPDALSRLFEHEQPSEEDNIQTKNQDNEITNNNNNNDNDNHAIRMFKPLESITPRETERKNLLETTHIKHAHCGSKALVDALHNDGLHWNNIKEDALNTVKQCSTCQKFNIAKHGFHPLQSIYAENPMDHICIDTAGPMPATSHNGNNYMLIVVDVFTRYCVVKPMPDKSALSVTLCLVDIFANYGPPKIIQHDNGTEYVNELVRLFLQHSGVEDRCVSPYNPRANGLAERWIQKVKNVVYKRLEGNDKDWEFYIPSTMYALNNTATKLHASKPFSLMFARRANEFQNYQHTVDKTTKRDTVTKRDQYLNDYHNIVIPAIRERIQHTQQAEQGKFGQSHNIIKEIPVGAEVMILNVNRTSKTEPRYIGYFTVKRKNKGGSYILEDKTGALYPRNVPPNQIKVISQEVVIPAENTYEVQAIIDHKGSPGKYLYRVRWKGYTEDDDTWEPAENFDNQAFINKYWKRRNEKQVEVKNSTNTLKHGNNDKSACH